MRRHLVTSQDIADAGNAIRLVCLETTRHVRHGLRNSLAHAARSGALEGWIVFSLNQVDAAAAGELAIAQNGWVLRRRVVGGVQSPITGDDIHAAIAIEVARRESVPPTGQGLESGRALPGERRVR